MLALNIGPLAMPAAPLVLLGALLLSAALARRLARAHGEAAAQAAESMIWWAAAAGLLAARAAHVLLHFEAYAGAPATWLDVRDGGMHALTGWAVAVLVLLAWLRPPRQGRGSRLATAPAASTPDTTPGATPDAEGRTAVSGALTRRAVWGAALAGGLAWGAGQGLLAWWAARRLPRAVPPQPLRRWRPPGVAGVPTEALLTDIVAGRPAVVNLWASWCAPCRAEMPLLAAVQQQRPDVRVVFVNQGESAAAVQTYLQRSGLQLDQLWLDPGAALGPALGSNGLPTTVFVDAHGRIVDAHMGMLNAAALRLRLQRL